ncbi:hypothetical protein Catovirus_2_286 [Catovirus CTV1]|uniref:Uncharacterized protein n=1 Tax=Catovirus CTV1 TaxID=1977631 RepID=A0A1V0SCA3_9VIRU|nr:hypothetical protein Catovirus_2_286 [Catovirus CTV1]
MSNNQYYLARYSYDDGETFFYVLDTKETIMYLNNLLKKYKKIVILEGEKFTSDVVNAVVSKSGINKIYCNSAISIHKCDNINDFDNIEFS